MKVFIVHGNGISFINSRWIWTEPMSVDNFKCSFLRVLFFPTKVQIMSLFTRSYWISDQFDWHNSYKIQYTNSLRILERYQITLFRIRNAYKFRHTVAPFKLAGSLFICTLVGWVCVNGSYKLYMSYTRNIIRNQMLNSPSIASI